MKKKTYEELIERRAALISSMEDENADLDAIEKEIREIREELERRDAEEREKREQQERREELRKMVAAGAGEHRQDYAKEKKSKEKTLKEVRSSQEYLNAWVEGIKTNRYDACKKMLAEVREQVTPEPLMTENGGGTIVVPTYVETQIRAIFENNAILNKVRKTYVRGNLKVSFEVSASDAVTHNEGGDAITDEELIFGATTIIAEMIKKTIEFSDEAFDMRGQEFIDYLMDEFRNKIEAALVALVIDLIADAGETTTAAAVGVPVVTASAATLDLIANALAEITNDNAKPAIFMNRRTIAAFRAAQLNANYAVDPFENLEVIPCSRIKSLSAASNGEPWVVVGDLYALTLNFPAGDDVKFVHDPYTAANRDMQRLTGRLYAGGAITVPGMIVKIVKGEAEGE